MIKHTLYLALFAIIAMGSCTKTNNNSSSNTQTTVNNTYGLNSISGLHNITLPKNKDTTVAMPITVNLFVNGYAQAPVAVTFGSLPTAILSVTPSRFTSVATDTFQLASDPLVFQISAVSIGTFPVIVTATDAGGTPSQISDTFNIIVTN